VVRLWYALSASYHIHEEYGLTEEELRQHLKAHGWGLQFRARRKTGKRYAYARRRRGRKVIIIYLCPESQVEELDAQTVESKVSRLS
jgi:RecB family exonuclease